MDLCEQPLQRHDFRAMGSAISVWLILDEPAQANALLHQAQQLFAVVEARMTRFDLCSELLTLNRAGGCWTPLAARCGRLLHAVLHLAEATGGVSSTRPC